MKTKSVVVLLLLTTCCSLLQNVVAAEIRPATQALLDKAVEAYDSHKFDEGVDLAKTALTAAQKSGDKTGAATVQDQLGALYMQMEDYEEALKAYDAAAALWRGLGEKDSAAESLASAGLACQLLEDYEEALKRHELSAALFKQAEDKCGAAGALENAGDAYSSLGDDAKALQYFQSALKLAREADDRSCEAEALNALGLHLTNMSRFDEALANHQMSLKISRELKDLNLEAETLSDIGEMYDFKEDVAKAEDYYQQSLKTYRAIPDNEGQDGEETVLGSLGALYEDTEQLDKALNAYRAIMQIAKERGDDLAARVDTLLNIDTKSLQVALLREDKDLTQPDAVELLNTIILDHIGEGEFTEALSVNDLTFAVAQGQNNGAGDKLLLALCWYRRGLLLQKSELNVAGECFVRSLALWQEVEGKAGEALTQLSLAEVYAVQGRLSDALQASTTALKLYREENDKSGEIESLGKIGDIYEKQGLYDKALAQQQATLQLAQAADKKDSECAAMLGIGVIYRAQGQNDLALAQFEKTRKRCEETDNSVIAIDVALEQAELKRLTGHTPEALKDFEEILPTLQEMKDEGKEAIVNGRIAKIHTAMGQHDEALTIFEENLDVFDKLGMLADQAETLNGLGEALLARNGQEDAKTALVAFQESLRIARDLGLPVLMQRAQEHMTKLVAAPAKPPSCRFITPKPDEQIPSNKLEVQVEATGDKEIDHVDIFLAKAQKPASRGLRMPSRALPSPTGGQPAPRFSRFYTAEVDIPPGNDDVLLRAFAYDVDGNPSEAATVTVQRGTAPAVPTGTLYLLSVGINLYEDVKVDTLKFAANDAKELAEVMKRQEGLQYAHANIISLTDKDATKAKILNALTMLKTAGPSDTVMVFLAGHGVQDEGKFYFAPHDINLTNVAGTGMAWAEVANALSSLPKNTRKFLLVDACHAGTQLGNQKATNGQIGGIFQSDSQIVVLASSSGDEVSYEDEKSKHGYFTSALLDAIKGKADFLQKGMVTMPDILSWLSGTVKRQHPQILRGQFSLNSPVALVPK